MDDSLQTLKRTIGRLTNDVLLKRYASGQFDAKALPIAEAEIDKRGLDTSQAAVHRSYARDAKLEANLHARRRKQLWVRLLLAAVVIAALAYGAKWVKAADAPAFDTAAIAGEARAFMAGYEGELRSGDRAAIAARYAPEGAIFAGWGPQSVETHDELAASYATQWQPPTSFRWCNVLVEPLSADAVLVSALFEWGQAEGVELMTYTGVLVRRDGALKIRLEHENRLAPESVQDLVCDPLAPPSP